MTKHVEFAGIKLSDVILMPFPVSRAKLSSEEMLSRLRCVLYNWAASRKKVVVMVGVHGRTHPSFGMTRNFQKGRCHSKNRMSAATGDHHSFGMTTTLEGPFHVTRPILELDRDNRNLTRSTLHLDDVLYPAPGSM